MRIKNKEPSGHGFMSPTKKIEIVAICQNMALKKA